MPKAKAKAKDQKSKPIWLIECYYGGQCWHGEQAYSQKGQAEIERNKLIKAGWDVKLRRMRLFL